MMGRWRYILDSTQQRDPRSTFFRVPLLYPLAYYFIPQLHHWARVPPLRRRIAWRKAQKLYHGA